jgi:putative IMPACT (imprinted ancient) family translation regulator
LPYRHTPAKRRLDAENLACPEFKRFSQHFLNVLQHKEVGDIVIVVVRYFGGIKLGAGGLTRAYGQAAQAVMEVLPLDSFEPQYAAQLKVDFSQEQSARHTLQLFNAALGEVHYQSQVTLNFTASKESLEEIQRTAQSQDWGFWQSSEDSH